MLQSAFAFKANCNVFSSANNRAFQASLRGNVSRLIGQHSRDEFFVFLSRHKAKAGTEALLMQRGPETRTKSNTAHLGHAFGHPVSLDTEELRDPTRLKENIRSSHNLVRLLTRAVFTTARGEYGPCRPCNRFAGINCGKRCHRIDVQTINMVAGANSCGPAVQRLAA